MVRKMLAAMSGGVDSAVAVSPGDFVDSGGRILGRHRGLIHYTVGQRRGLGLSFGQPKDVHHHMGIILVTVYVMDIALSGGRQMVSLWVSEGKRAFHQLLTSASMRTSAGLLKVSYGS